MNCMVLSQIGLSGRQSLVVWERSMRRRQDCLRRTFCQSPLQLRASDISFPRRLQHMATASTRQIATMEIYRTRYLQQLNYRGLHCDSNEFPVLMFSLIGSGVWIWEAKYHLQSECIIQPSTTLRQAAFELTCIWQADRALP